KSLASMPIAAVSQRNIANLLNEIAKEKGDTTSNRVRTSLCTLFGWAIREGIKFPEGNVASYTNKREEVSRDRVLTDAELKAIWGACIDDDYGAIVKLLLLTGQRESEIGLLRWNEVHDDQLVLPGDRTKNGRTHVVPLSDLAKEILGKREDRAFVFGRDDTGFKGWSKAKEKLDARIAERTTLPHWRIHDLRRTV